MKLFVALASGVAVMVFSACKENAPAETKTAEPIAAAPAASPAVEAPIEEEEFLGHRDAPEEDADPRNFGVAARGIGEAPAAAENTEREAPSDDVGPSETHAPVIAEEPPPIEEVVEEPATEASGIDAGIAGSLDAGA